MRLGRMTYEVSLERFSYQQITALTLMNEGTDLKFVVLVMFFLFFSVLTRNIETHAFSLDQQEFFHMDLRFLVFKLTECRVDFQFYLMPAEYVYAAQPRATLAKGKFYTCVKNFYEQSFFADIF